MVLCCLHRFHEVFTGNSVAHRVTRLQPDTKYIFRVAAISHSGQGDWSDYVSIMTTPPPPMIPRGIELTQLSNRMLQLTWEPVSSPFPLVYEVQYRMANVNQEYQQVEYTSRWSVGGTSV